MNDDERRLLEALVRERATLDLWEIVACEYCGAAPGEYCRTSSGALTSSLRSHSPRIVWAIDEAQT